MNNVKMIEKQILAQMGIDSDKIVQDWETKNYMMNSRYVAKFWDQVAVAPAIRIVGDYDCDGVMGSLIMSKAIHALYPNIPLSVRIPRRLSEGYGMNQKIVDEIKFGSNTKAPMPKGSLIITVDNGIAAASVLESLTDDYHVIVTDHHELGNNIIPNVDLVINPKIPSVHHSDNICTCKGFDGDYWCGAAVAYKIAESMLDETLAKELEIYAGIATVGDCMPLKEGNHGLVRRLVNRTRAQDVPDSLLKLLEAMGQSPANTNAETFGYYISPAINASGRLIDDGATKPLSYFLNPTPEKCQELVAINEQRKTLRDEKMAEAVEIIENSDLKNQCPIWLKMDNVPEGIVGILAGNIAGLYNVPVIVLTESETPGILKGSARSAGNINIFQYLQSCGDIFEKFGGHEGAAGLSLKEENLEIARQHQLQKPTLSETTEYIIAQIQNEEISDISYMLEKYRPFGEGNPAPHFITDAHLSMTNHRMLGAEKNHLAIQGDNYKILHFYHEPNELRDKVNFMLEGTITQNIFRDKITAQLTADTIFDENDIEYSAQIKEIG